MSNDSEVLELLYNKLKSYGRLDKEGVLRILGLEYTNWNMRKALNYLKDLANKYEDVELKKGDKGKYYVEWSGYSEAVKDDIKKSFDAEAFEKDFWRNVYYIAIDRIKPGDTICRVIEVMDIRDFTKIWKKYKLWIVGDWINLKLSEDDPTGAYVEYVGSYVLDFNKYKLFSKVMDLSELRASSKTVYKSKAEAWWRGNRVEGAISYYNLIKINNKLYVFEVDASKLYNPKTEEIYLPSRVLIYNLNDGIDVDTILKELKGCKKSCSNIIYMVRDFDRRMAKAEEIAKDILVKILSE